MAIIRNDINNEAIKAKGNLELVAGLAKKIFGCSASWGNGDIVLFNEPQEWIAKIYPLNNMLDLFNPLYAAEARRFGESFETAFLKEVDNFLINRLY